MKEQNSLRHKQRRARRPLTDKRLSRSSNKVIGGVAAGLAEFIEANPAHVRWVFVVILILSAGIAVVPYLLLYWLLPKPK